MQAASGKTVAQKLLKATEHLQNLVEHEANQSVHQPRSENAILSLFF